jgi:hypothetical protein
MTRRTLRQDAHHERLHLMPLRTGMDQRRGHPGRPGLDLLRDPARHRLGIADDRTRDRHQPTIRAHQGLQRFGRSGLAADRPHASSHAAQAIAHTAGGVSGARYSRAREHAHAVPEDLLIGSAWNPTPSRAAAIPATIATRRPMPSASACGRS